MNEFMNEQINERCTLMGKTTSAFLAFKTEKPNLNFE